MLEYCRKSFDVPTSRATIAFLAVLLLATVPGQGPMCFAQGSTGDVTPRSGYIETTGYRIDDEGQKSEQSLSSTTWFTATNTRTESYELGVPTHIGVNGDRIWSAYPRIKRFQRHAVPPWGFRSYTAEVRLCAERFEEKEPVGRARILNLTCTKYSWHVAPDADGDLCMPEHDVDYWVHTDEQFPIILRYESTLGSGYEVAKMDLNCEVSDSRFEEPEAYRLIAPLTLPKKPFTIEIAEQRSSGKYGWTENITHLFTKRGETVEYRREKKTTHARGKESASASEKELSPEQAVAQLSRCLDAPYWPGVVEQSRVRWKAMEASLYVPDSQRKALKTRWLVADHPVLGTMTVKIARESQNHVTEVKRIFIDDADRTGDEEKAADLPDEKIIFKTIGEVDLWLHIFKPEGFRSEDKRPAIVFFFGGGWVGGSPSQFYPHCRYLASRGMVAISAEYRVKSRHGTTPYECVKDGKSAIRSVRTHAVELGIDPNRIAAGGGSAGGHVAAATALVQGFEEPNEPKSVSSRPNALVLFNPVFDNGPTGYGHDRVKDHWRKFSPMHNIGKAAPPTIVFLGTNDKLIPVSTAKDYKHRMEEFGRRCDLHLYEGQPHGFFNYRDGNNTFYYQTVIEADRFLRALGYLKGEATLTDKTLN